MRFMSREGDVKTKVAQDELMLPELIYGTAWKEDDTERLVSLALETGFRGIDTANQRKHYHEAQVGDALTAAFARGLRRDELFVQTKFTFLTGQDQRLPYDPKASIGEQVEQSFASSLTHLGLSTLDSFVLHGPSSSDGWSTDDAEAWSAMEGLHARHLVGALGVSNVCLAQLEKLLASATVQPRFVQNRCFARSGWDAEVRAFCRKQGIRYQPFSLLTGNPQVVTSSALREVARRTGRTPAQVVFRFAKDVGMLPLTGTGDQQHMKADLCLDFTLTPDDLAMIDRVWR